MDNFLIDHKFFHKHVIPFIKPDEVIINCDHIVSRETFFIFPAFLKLSTLFLYFFFKDNNILAK